MLRALVLIITLTGAVSLRIDSTCKASPTRVTPRRALLVGMPLIALLPRAAAADATLHIVDYPVKGACGQAQVPDKAVPFVKAFGGFSDGECASDGYSAKQGTANGTGEKDKDRTYEIYGKQ